ILAQPAASFATVGVRGAGTISPAYPPPPAANVAVAAFFYLGIAVVFGWLGGGTILARRWARTLNLALGWVWLVTGAVGRTLPPRRRPGRRRRAAAPSGRAGRRVRAPRLPGCLRRPLPHAPAAPLRPLLRRPERPPPLRGARSADPLDRSLPPPRPCLGAP